MYVTLLLHSMDEWSDAPTPEALLDHVLARRAVLLGRPSKVGESVYGALAAEVGYDRALIKLSVARGIATSSAHFATPAHERRRLERALVDEGVDLADLARRRRA
jgi:hypothetical protein